MVSLLQTHTHACLVFYCKGARAQGNNVLTFCHSEWPRLWPHRWPFSSEALGRQKERQHPQNTLSNMTLTTNHQFFLNLCVCPERGIGTFMTGCVCVESGAWGALHIQCMRSYIFVFLYTIFMLAYNVTKIKLKGCTDNTQATILATTSFSKNLVY